MINIKKQDPVADVVKDILQQEALKGNQHKIDKNKNNKIDSHDFKILRGEKPEVKEGWDDMLKAGKERAERERQEMGTGKFNKQEVKPGVVRYTKKPEKYEPAEKTQKEEVEQIDELKKSTLGSYVSKASRDATIQRKIGADFETLADKSRKPSMKKAATTLSDKYKAKTWSRLAGVDKAVGRLAKEEVEQVDEATMTHITLGKKVKNSDGGHNQDVHYKGKKIGSIESYTHRTGLRYGGKHDASGDMEAGSRSSEEAVDFVRTAHADHLRSMKKEEVEQVQEREMTSGETAERERIVKGMKKGFSGFRQRYGDKAKSVMYATATKNAMKEEALEEGKRPEGDTVPFIQNANTSSSPMKKIKEVAGAAMKKISKDLKTK
jgi:hypothetical protein